MHRFAAAGVAVTGLAVPLLLRQARQHLFYVQPLVGVQPFGFGELARILQMAAADVVGSQGEPGAIRFQDAFRQPGMDLDQILATALDALHRVEAIGHAHGVGGAQGQHHQPAHAGLGGGLRLPVGFLIADGGQQAPVDAMLLGRLAKGFLITRQALLQMLGEGIGADVAEHVDVAVVALAQALQRAVLLGLFKEGVGCLEQADVLALGYDPGQAVLLADVETGTDVGEVHLVHGHLVGLHQGQVDLALVDHAQQVDHFYRIGLLVAQVRILGLQRGQLLGLAAALEHHDALADQILRAGRSALAAAVDDLGGDVEIRAGEARQLLPAFAGHQAGGGECRATRAIEAVENLFDVVGGFDLQLDAEGIGEALDQFVFEAGFAVAILEIGGRAVAGDHAQYAFLLNALKLAGLFGAAAEHQEDSDRQQPGGAALAEQGMGKHRRSIRKGEPPPYLDSERPLC